MTHDLLHSDRVTRTIDRYLNGTIDATRLEIELDLYLRPHTVIPSVRQGIYPRSTVIAAAIELMPPGHLPLGAGGPIKILGEPL